MSNIKLNPNKLTVYYTATTLSIIAGGRHRRFRASNVGEDMLREIYLAAKQYKTNPSPENEDKLLRFIDKSYRMKLNDIMIQDMEGNVYLEEMPNIVLPTAVEKMLLKYMEEGLEITPILNLWKLALDNPSEQAREDLMLYLETFGSPVTDNGYMILYKAVQNKDQDMIEKLSFFVGEEFFKARKNRVKPNDLWVYELPDDHAYSEGMPRFWVDSEPVATYDQHVSIDEYGEIIVDEDAEIQSIGRLDELFEDYVINKKDIDPDEDPEADVVWKPFHTGGNYGNEIRLGEVITMPREECDPDINVSCSKGLHVGSYEYVSTFGGHSDSRTVLACLVNPKDIVALPKSDHSKIRTCAYMPYGIIEIDEEGNWDEVTSPYWEEDFLDYEKEELEQRIASLQDDMSQSSEEKKARIEDLLNNAKNRLTQLNG